MKNRYHFIHTEGIIKGCVQAFNWWDKIIFPSVLSYPFEYKQIVLHYLSPSLPMPTLQVWLWFVREKCVRPSAVSRPPFRFLRHKKLLEPFIGQWRGLIVIFQSFFTLRCFVLLAGHPELLAGIFFRGLTLNSHKVEDDAIFEVTKTLCKNSSIWRVTFH